MLVTLPTPASEDLDLAPLRQRGNAHIGGQPAALAEIDGRARLPHVLYRVYRRLRRHRIGRAHGLLHRHIHAALSGLLAHAQPADIHRHLAARIDCLDQRDFADMILRRNGGDLVPACRIEIQRCQRRVILGRQHA